jgi:hypothetical protein
MNKPTCLSIFALIAVLCLPLTLLNPASAQQTLGGITGAVTDPSGAALPDTTVTAVGDQTTLTRTQKTDSTGVYTFVNLPIGSYTLTFTHDSFQTQKIPSITVQANRTATVNASLSVGAVSTTITVAETPLVNAVDTTNGYVLDKVQIEAVPLPTGSFTGLAILSPGVNAELPSGNGVNAGLGNNPIWANGQRDTSNTFLLNGVDAKNLFNGKSTSSVGSGRVVLNTGISGAATASALEIQSSASPYLAVGQALPSPAPETIQEVRVNTSMYDAQQGSTSGAHIDMSTASGTNDIHGQVYLHRATDWLNAAPFFFKQDPHITQKVPQLHREVPGGMVGGPLIKNKLFGFVAYQHTHASDQQIGLGRATVPLHFTSLPINGVADPNCVADRTNVVFQQCVVDVVNNQFVPLSFNPPVPPITAANVDPIALKLLQAKLPNGQYLIPYSDGIQPNFNFPEDAIIPGTAFFLANQAVANLDFIATPTDTLALKYYYQHDPTTAPFAYSSVGGFTQHLDAGSQVATITNTQTLTPTLNVAEVFGFIREKVYSTIGQPPGFTPADLGINAFGKTNLFPGITMSDALGTDSPGELVALQLGEGAASQGALTGVFQNRFMPSANAIWIKGRHTITFGGAWSHTQLNTRNRRTDNGTIGFADFSQFVEGMVTPYTADGFIVSAFLQGNANRYYRANETGEYVQDKFQLRPNLSVTFGLRFDYNGGLTEKNGLLYNFDPTRFVFCPDQAATASCPDPGGIAIDAKGNAENGFIIAGNNKTFPTKGVSNSTLTGRQWGLAPRIGVAWSPKMFNNKVVVRAGWGMYYDRGELFVYLSPGFAAGVIPGGPFGVTQSPPYVNAQSCTSISPNFYLGFVPTCASPVDPILNPNGGDFANPWGATLGPGPSGNPALLNLPDTTAIEKGAQLFSFAVYNRKNKLPYTMNQTLDVQWQPRNDLAIDVGYVGNLGRHEVIPIPFNQSRIATPTAPVCGPATVCANPATAFAPQYYAYGYTVLDPVTFTPIALPPVNGQPVGNYQANFESGNVDLRVPYIGYSSESESYTAVGVSAYDALQTHVEKRMSHGVQLGFSYTYSHARDEQSALGLFYNGNNPTKPGSAYGNADFDRTHVFNLSYFLQLHNFAPESSWQGKIIDGWALAGSAIIQSGQPYSIIDFSGAVGSIFYGTANGITNPIVPLAPGCTPQKALTGHIGAYDQPALDANCFTIPLLNPGALNGAVPTNDPYETDFIPSGQRNIFRQSWQKRADISIIKNTKINERLSVRYSFDVFNFTNTPSFDIPIDDVTQNEFFDSFPVAGTDPKPNSCPNPTNVSFYNCPGGLGLVNKVIGSARQIQMSLSFLF